MLGTYLDIAFTISKLACFARNPSPNYFIIVKYIFCYLAGMLLLLLFYPSILSNLNSFINTN
jgi:hypothetical protein